MRVRLNFPLPFKGGDQGVGRERSERLFPSGVFAGIEPAQPRTHPQPPPLKGRGVFGASDVCHADGEQWLGGGE
jgi:hypothetical protein